MDTARTIPNPTVELPLGKPLHKMWLVFNCSRILQVGTGAIFVLLGRAFSAQRLALDRHGYGSPKTFLSTESEDQPAPESTV